MVSLIKNSSIPCVYCKKIINAAELHQSFTSASQNEPNKKKKSRIPAEHVIPQLLGLFGKDTMTLNNMVCAVCNKFFSEKLELTFGRDSVYGILYRSVVGIFINEKSLRHKRKKLTLEVYSPNYGKTLVNLYPDAEHLFKVRIADQFTLLNSTKGVQVNFSKNQLPSREQLESLGLPMRPAYITFLGPEFTPQELSKKTNEINKILRKSGIIPKSNWGSVNKLPSLPNDAPLMFSSQIDDIILRTIAKIAFNYFVYNWGYRLAMSDSFDNIRNYVLYGLRTDYNIVWLTHRSIFSHTSSLSKEQFGHHAISVFQDGQRIIADVLLFNRDSFEVIISNDYPLLSPVFFSKHKFDILKKEIVPMPNGIKERTVFKKSTQHFDLLGFLVPIRSRELGPIC